MRAMLQGFDEYEAGRFAQEFSRWFEVELDREKGIAKLTLKHDARVSQEHIRRPGETIEQFVDRFLAFAWRTLWSLT